MNCRVLEFRKSYHFMFSQWNRGFTDGYIRRLCSFIHAKDEKQILAFSPTFLENKRLLCNGENHLVMVLNYRLLVTIYWCPDPAYLEKTEPSTPFLQL